MTVPTLYSEVVGIRGKSTECAEAVVDAPPKSWPWSPGGRLVFSWAPIIHNNDYANVQLMNRI